MNSQILNFPPGTFCIVSILTASLNNHIKKGTGSKQSQFQSDKTASHQKDNTLQGLYNSVACVVVESKKLGILHSCVWGRLIDNFLF
jgi:hypothetical protein